MSSETTRRDRSRRSNRPAACGQRAARRWFARLGLVAVLGLAVVGGGVGAAKASTPTAVVSAGLLDRAISQPTNHFGVILQAAPGVTSDTLFDAVSAELQIDPSSGSTIRKRYAVIRGLAANLSGTQLVALASSPAVGTITEDLPVQLTSSAGGFSNQQLWPDVTAAPRVWASGLQTPAIAIVDSGVDAARLDFGGRVVKQVGFGRGDSSGDSYGHGTFVASIAAGESAGYAGVAPQSPIISLDVLGDDGSGRLRDVVSAADWIYRNRGTYNIRIANFSLTSSATTSFIDDPLDAAVEKLWLAGVVVVAAAGNYASDGQASGVLHAPGNDPFVITVGANDINGTADTGDDFAAPWSAWGYTPDGFLKPDVCAPGRVMTAAAPTSSAMYTQHPERVVEPGYMWMSGTSFAAPAVSGTAAYILARHPGWSPDQVKGALMLSAQPGQDPSSTACGVGEISAAAADVASPPNPNAALDAFVVTDKSGGGTLAFDGASWPSAAQANESWDAASWSSASWSSASWSSASWSSASWSSASWSSASWSSGTSPDGTLPTSAELTWVK
jgi:serine protease AprX